MNSVALNDVNDKRIEALENFLRTAKDFEVGSEIEQSGDDNYDDKSDENNSVNE